MCRGSTPRASLREVPTSPSGLGECFGPISSSTKGKELLSRRLCPPARWGRAVCSGHKLLEQEVVAGGDVQAPVPAELPVH